MHVCKDRNKNKSSSLFCTDIGNYLLRNEAKIDRLKPNDYIILFSYKNSTISSKSLRQMVPQMANLHHEDLDLARGKESCI